MENKRQGGFRLGNKTSFSKFYDAIKYIRNPEFPAR